MKHSWRQIQEKGSRAKTTAPRVCERDTWTPGPGVGGAVGKGTGLTSTGGIWCESRRDRARERSPDAGRRGGREEEGGERKWGGKGVGGGEGRRWQAELGAEGESSVSSR